MYPTPPSLAPRAAAALAALLLCITAADSHAKAKADDADSTLAHRQVALLDALACGNRHVTANTIAGMVYAIGGHSPHLGAERSLFTWPESLWFYGERIDRVTISRRATGYGKFVDLAVRLPGEDLPTLAYRAGMTLEQDGIFRRWNGPNELTLQIEHGSPVMVCTPNSNTWRVRIQRFFHSARHDA